MTPSPRYVLGSDDVEIGRLDRQAAMIAPATAMLLRAAGIQDGMRVLDLGTGLGHVAFELAGLVGPSGSVVGIDQSEALLAVAEGRRRDAGRGNVRFLQADARTFRDPEPFDAIVARLLLFHLPDAADVVRHHRDALLAGGLWVALDFDVGAARAHPPVALVTEAVRWVEEGFRSAGADPRVGARLPGLLAEAGFDGPAALGVQPYVRAADPSAAALLAGVVRALAPQIVAAGIAREADVDPAAFQERLARELRTGAEVLLPPALVGAWARR